MINSSGQPVVTNTTISSTVFNAFTADIATGLSTAVCKDGQTATTARVPFAQGISSTLTTDATSITTGSIITAGGISTQKSLWVGGVLNVAGATTLTTSVTGSATMAVFNTTSTTVNAFGAATTLNIGNTSGITNALGNWSIGGAFAVTKSGGTAAIITQTGATGYGVSIIPGADTVYDAFVINNAANTLNQIRMYGNGTATFAGGIGIGGSASPGASGLDVTGVITTTTYLWAKGVGNLGGLYFGAAGSTSGHLSQASDGGSSASLYIGNALITAVSDRRLKANIVPTTRDALSLLNKWEIVDHTWNDPSDQCENNRNSRGVWTGVIAQQIQSITPWLVNKPLKDNEEDGTLNPWVMDFGYAVPLLVKAIQELTAQNKSLTARIAALEAA